MMQRLICTCLAGVLVLPLLLSAGCVKRTMTITSEPPGALVWVNDREVGRTPVDVPFVYYGIYDVQLQGEGQEPLMTSGRAAAPWWDLPGPDLVAELLPMRLHSRVRLHYDLPPLQDEPEALVDRARHFRDITNTAEPEE